MSNTVKENIVNEAAAEFTAYGEASAAAVIEILKACYSAQMPVMLVGDPGVGKTALIGAFTRDYVDGEMYCLIGSQLEPQDVSGLPHAAADNKGAQYTEYLVPTWQKKIMDGEVKVLFLDEFSNSPASIQAAELKLVGERRFANGDKMPDDVFIVMAMNPENSAVDYTPIAAPMANRICFISYRPTDTEVYEGLAGGWFTDEEKANWSESETKWRERVVDFLRSTNGTYILEMNRLAEGSIEASAPAYLRPEEENNDSEREILLTTWSSPRSWDNVCRVLGTMPFTSEVDAIQERILTGTVGRKASVYLKEWVHAHSQIDAFDVIKNPEKVEWKVDSSNGVAYNDILEIVEAIVVKIPKCDGMNGRPDINDALSFFSQVVDLGGGAHFVPYVGRSNSPLWKHMQTHRPSDVSHGEWIEKLVEVTRKYANAGLSKKRDDK